MSLPYTIDLDKRRSLRAIFVAALSLYRRYPLLFVLLALPVVASYDLGLLAITGYGPLVSLGRHSQGLFWLNILLRAALVSPLISALHVYAVQTAGEGRPPQLRPVALRGLAVLPVVGATALLTIIGTTIGLFAFLVPGFLLAAHWAVAAQAAAVEREGPVAAIASSNRLTQGRRIHVLGLFLAIAIIAVAADELARALPLGSSSGVASVAVGISVQTLVASLGALTLALLYFDLRAPARAEPQAPKPHSRKPRPVLREQTPSEPEWLNRHRGLR